MLVRAASGERFSGVSTRARPWGRAMPDAACFAIASHMFQPAPGRGAGRCHRGADGIHHLGVFQPAPGRGAGRCLIDVLFMPLERVSTRARPWGRAMPALAGQDASLCGVSTRARPWGRAMPGRLAQGVPHRHVSTRARPWGRAMLSHQAIVKRADKVSTRARPWGRAMRGRSEPCAPGPDRFNPRPAVGPGDAIWDAEPFDQVQAFQPAPGRGAGRCSLSIAKGGAASMFQPAPGRGAGRCPRACSQARGDACFNPRPAVGPGDAAWLHLVFGRHVDRKSVV